MKLPPVLVGIRAAVVFMTRLPVGGFPYRDEDWTWAPAHFPFVGLLIGGLGAGALWLTRGLSPELSAAIAVLVMVAATGAFHEDGLADTFDALGGAHGPKQLFEILKDSRLGTYGVSALLFSLLLRILALPQLASKAFLLLPLAHALARTGPVWLMILLPAAGAGTKSGVVARGGTRSRGLVALGWAFLSLAAAHALGLRWPGLLLLSALCVLMTAWSGLWYLRRAGGWTGDFLGATEQLCELPLLILAPLLCRYDLL